MGMHKVSVDNFVIFYMIDSTVYTVTIIRIVYGGRNIQCILSQDNND